MFGIIVAYLAIGVVLDLLMTYYCEHLWDAPPVVAMFLWPIFLFGALIIILNDRLETLRNKIGGRDE